MSSSPTFHSNLKFVRSSESEETWLKESIHEKAWCKLIIISLVLLGLSTQFKMGK